MHRLSVSIAFHIFSQFNIDSITSSLFNWFSIFHNWFAAESQSHKFRFKPRFSTKIVDFVVYCLNLIGSRKVVWTNLSAEYETFLNWYCEKKNVKSNLNRKMIWFQAFRNKLEWIYFWQVFGFWNPCGTSRGCREATVQAPASYPASGEWCPAKRCSLYQLLSALLPWGWLTF